eukprot:GHVS01057872.1.p1 GENE.GHVS01057872.1~~GHVS01057872.1.p1  ORF type:complete len:608 (+),score=87.52 GHVS01057872.1:198-2021(+)
MWGKILSSVSSALDFNQATLSGCIDIIVVEQEHAEPAGLRSTPFHVRFGKAKLLRSREKIVSISVNGRETELRMKLGAAGEAYFVEETNDSIVEGHETSPFASPALSPRSSFALAEEQPNDTNNEAVWSWGWGDLPQPEQRPNGDSSTGSPLPPGISTDWEEQKSKVAFSMCGHLLYGTPEEVIHDEEVFRANLITWEQMEMNPLLWYNPSMVALFGGAPPFYPGKVAMPMLASWVMFGRPLPVSALQTLVTCSVTATQAKDRSWMSWWSSDPVTLDSPAVPSSSSRHIPSPASPPEDGGGGKAEEEGKKFRKSLRPTSEQLKSLGLSPGANRITFRVSSSLQGTKSVSSTIYLWPQNAKIVISDVDGTITRSDVLGQLMPIVGRDWSHSGVADLYTKVRQNGYFLLYLTARAIGQADSTRDYLFGLTQNAKEKLPDGPLILSPDRLFPSFKREVIDRKPYVFKIAALRDIRNLFPKNYNPFYAGFGNRDSDHRAYVHIGVPEGKVFIIDPRGVIHHVNTTYARTYASMSEICQYMFPAVRGLPYEEDENVREKKLLTHTLYAADSRVFVEEEVELAERRGEWIDNGSPCDLFECRGMINRNMPIIW